MAEVFVSKVRPLGSSLGIIIPKKIIEEENLESGKEIQVTIVRKNFKAIEKLIGSMKGAKPFVRDRVDRV